MATSSKLLSTIALASTLFSPLGHAIWPKRGLAANDDINISEFGGTYAGLGSQVNWQYNWDSTTYVNKQSYCEYIPMLWGTASDHTTQWFSNAYYWLSVGSGHLLAFNEPEQSGQANLTPQQAADAFREYLTPFVGVASIGAPAVSNDGYAWLSEFLPLCEDCGIDFIPIHWYNNWDQFADFQNWVTAICDFGYTVWVTEFEGYGSVDQQSAFLKQAIPWLDNNDCVYRYAYFGVADPDTILLENGGPDLSPIGIQYTYTPYGGTSCGDVTC
ncbi:glycosyl hydrolase catalytic core-domain-containing protein [Xylariales sp. PMI_506]|nr:glycosyl hydrolase catalytic core-domain-containing protein [Xylariales sp. PMI_506]